MLRATGADPHSRPNASEGGLPPTRQSADEEILARDKNNANVTDAAT